MSKIKDDIIYKHALTFSHEELAGMYSLCNKREQEYLKEIKALKLILQSHGEVIEENARLREALKEAVEAGEFFSSHADCRKDSWTCKCSFCKDTVSSKKLRDARKALEKSE